MTDLTLYHNPRCSKSRGALELLEARGLTLDLADTSLSEAQLIAAIAAHPKLMERPILEVGDKAIIGRPPEQILELLP
jgi:arsenate reductase